MNADEIMEIIKQHLDAAEAELAKCGRGSNHGAVRALRELAAAVGLEAQK